MIKKYPAPKEQPKVEQPKMEAKSIGTIEVTKDNAVLVSVKLLEAINNNLRAINQILTQIKEK